MQFRDACVQQRLGGKVCNMFPVRDDLTRLLHDPGASRPSKHQQSLTKNRSIAARPTTGSGIFTEVCCQSKPLRPRIWAFFQAGHLEGDI